MCEANLYLKEGDQETLFLESVAKITPGTDNSLFLVDIFGSQQTVTAKIIEINLLKHKVVIEKLT